jgi:hypothetical protein
MAALLDETEDPTELFEFLSQLGDGWAAPLCPALLWALSSRRPPALSQHVRRCVLGSGQARRQGRGHQGPGGGAGGPYQHTGRAAPLRSGQTAGRPAVSLAAAGGAEAAEGNQHSGRVPQQVHRRLQVRESPQSAACTLTWARARVRAGARSTRTVTSGCVSRPSCVGLRGPTRTPDCDGAHGRGFHSRSHGHLRHHAHGAAGACA